MLTVPPSSLQGWIHALGDGELPVLGRTVAELARLREDEERVAVRDISRVLLHDPLLTVRVLRYLQSSRRRADLTELTTIEHAVMMMGIGPFFERFSAVRAVEETLGAYPDALEGLMRVMSRAYHAALYARDWAALRRDIEADEVAVAAQLHDLAEMLLWCSAPETALRIERYLALHPAGGRGVAQRATLGFSLGELQLALVAEWDLPRLLQSLMDDAHVTQARVLNTVLAVELARHCARGWDDPSLPDDYVAIGRLLGLTLEEVLAAVHRVALQAARSQDWYGVTPPAAWL